MNRIKLDELRRIAAMIEQLCDDDEQLFADMIEGETDVDRIVTRLHDQIQTDEALSVGITARMANLKDRKTRINNRIDASKAAIGEVLKAVKLSKLELPEVTYSVRDGKPGLDVVDGAAVPDEYMKPQPAKVDKAAINDAFDPDGGLPNWLTRIEPKMIVTGRTK